MCNIKTLEWKDDMLILLDCTKLPTKEEYMNCKKYTELLDAIKRLVVRGAPAIGVAAAYGTVLACNCCIENNYNNNKTVNYIKEAIKCLRQTRPTAVNLFWSLNRMENKLNEVMDLSNEDIKNNLLSEANSIFNEDIKTNINISKYGNEVVSNKARILTHCNAGALATAGYGTALGVIRYAFKQGKDIKVYADETRPLLQGARLTAFELKKQNIPVTLITDSMAGYCMKLGMIDMVIVGADRITVNGDVANKIGSYSLAVLAKYHNIPFYVAAPVSTIDLNLKYGKDIPIEKRREDEVRKFLNEDIAPKNVEVFNPAFDVIPNELIKGIITEKGILSSPYYDNILNVV